MIFPKVSCRYAAVGLAGALFFAGAANAAEVTRVSAGAFPISSVTVTPAGSAIVSVSGTTASPPSAGAALGDTKAQTISALIKIGDLLKAQGLGLGDIVMMRVFLTADPGTGKMDFAGMMAGYTQFFGTAAQPNKPARTTVQVAGLAAPGAMVEIEAQAARTK